jgi:hypothetical protein
MANKYLIPISLAVLAAATWAVLYMIWLLNGAFEFHPSSVTSTVATVLYITAAGLSLGALLAFIWVVSKKPVWNVLLVVGLIIGMTVLFRIHQAQKREQQKQSCLNTAGSFSKPIERDNYTAFCNKTF